MRDRAILHIDGDDYFASLARFKQPRLKGRPVIVGNLQSRGYVVAASYEARAAGIHSGMTMAQAERMCPDGAQVQVDWREARNVSTVLGKLLNRYSPNVERMILDAMFLDYTGSRMLFGPAPDFARRLQREIRDNLKLSVSVGLAADKAVSAVACRAAKLGKFQEVKPGRERQFLVHCPVGWLPGVTAPLKEQFQSLGVQNIGMLADIPEEILQHIFGSLGPVLSRRARGMESAGVRSRRPPDEPQVQDIFPVDLLRIEDLEAKLAHLSGRLGSELRHRQRSARYLLMRLVYADGVPVHRQRQLSPPSHRDPDLFRAARGLLGVLYTRRVRVKSLALTARHITYCPSELPLDEAARRAKWDRVLTAMDRVKTRFPDSRAAIRLAASLI
jgi:DNA polymerase IV